MLVVSEKVAFSSPCVSVCNRDEAVLFSWYVNAGVLVASMILLGRQWRQLAHAKKQVGDLERRAASIEATSARDIREANAKVHFIILLPFASLLMHIDL